MPSEPGFDRGLLVPVSVGSDALVSDTAVLTALVTVEVALARAWNAIGEGASAEIERVFGWTSAGECVTAPRVDIDDIAAAAVMGGNPVIPLVGAMRRLVAPEIRDLIHRGATSQDVLDSALMLMARRAVTAVLEDLRAVEMSLSALAASHRDTVAPARTLTQHAVPTTLGARVAAWLRGLRRARHRLHDAAAQLPAQLGGAGGSQASFAALAGDPVAVERLAEVFAAELGLAAPTVPWHTERWPVTELGDALVQVADALGVFAADVATGARTEIGEWIVSAPGGSSSMPQKRNPAAAVLVRSAAIRAPQLGATLHIAATLAVDERPDGAWHAEWPALRDLLRLALGAAATARALATGLSVDVEAVGRTLALTGGLLVAERLSIEVAPLIGAEALAALLQRAAAGEDLAGMLRGVLPRGIDVDQLLNPAAYTGRAGSLVDRTLEDER